MKPPRIDTGLSLDDLPEVKFDTRREQRSVSKSKAPKVKKPKKKRAFSFSKKPKPTVRSLAALHKVLPVSHDSHIPGPRSSED